jgi:hypothetical protein
LDLRKHLSQQVGIVGKTGRFGEFRGIDVSHALAAHEVLQHFRERILRRVVAVGRIEWVGGHDPADRRCDC